MEVQASLVRSARAFVADRTVLLFGQASGSVLLKDFFTISGASRVLAVPAVRNHGACITDSFQAQNDALRHPSGALRDYFHAVDPRRRAVVYAGSAVSVATVDGRRVLGSRKAAWRDAERKKNQTSLTQGQDHYHPFYIDGVRDLSGGEILARCKDAMPCVLSGDPTGRIGMGTDYVYLLRDCTATTVTAICSRLRQECDGVRVGAFTDGIPATYYGFVAEDRCVLYGPVEALVGCRRDDAKIIAPGILVPLPLPRELLSKAKEHVLAVLRTLVARTGYRGAFGIDGCFSGDAFVVHDVNTRICAGFSLLARLCANIVPFGMIDMLLRERRDPLAEILDALDQDTDVVARSLDVKLWEDQDIENALRSAAPRSDSASDVHRWRESVRRRALAECTPFHNSPVNPVV